jgi:signal transduction histidine kinase
VADTGPGVPAQALARIFDRFYRAEKSRHGQGSGLGLAIARGTLESHGGEVAAANPMGGGFRIEVKLPRYLEPGASRAEPMASRGRPRATEHGAA